MAEQLIEPRAIVRHGLSRRRTGAPPPGGADAATPAGCRGVGRSRGEKLLHAATAIGLVHHLDHVLRADNSGWPFTAQATPFTASLLVYPVMLLALRARSRPWLRVGLVAAVYLATQAAHLVVERPGEQYHTWAHGVSADPAALGAPNLLGIASPTLGLLAAGWSLLLSAALLATLVAFVVEARRAGAR
jgi:hypothetical protein